MNETSKPSASNILTTHRTIAAMIIVIPLAAIFIASSINIQSASAQNISEITPQANLNTSNFINTIDLEVDNKTFPIKYNITGAKLLGVFADKDTATLVLVLGSPAEDGGRLTMELPRNVIDAKGVGNEDTEFNIRIDGNGVEYNEPANNANARIVEIDFSGDNRVIEISGTQMV